VEAGVDACAALQVHLDIPGEATTECHFLLGQGRDRAEAVALALRYRDPGAARAAWRGTREGFDRLLDTVQVSTPDPALDLMLNRWFLYETVSARVLGRTGFYQSSGAFGFRDQLQDVLALLFAAPKVARAHLLEAARHQFEEGDVLHWWHPPSGRGVRTRCSDDLLWLPYTVAAYVSSTGDRAVLDELLPYLAAPPLRKDEDERYEWFRPGHVSDDLYGHCLRALEHGWRPGPHGLPLMGTGDWNDGMNRLGRKGVGESVWLAWFLIATLRDFAAVARERGDHRRADGFEERARGLARTVEETAWDGEWYLRAFTDEGEPVGTAAARVCRIDAISQAWAAISGSGDPDRARQAMAAVETHLVGADDRLVLLLAPPFDRLSGNVGYIRAYPPGIRENGGQYTHAAAWVGFAHASLGDGDLAARILSFLNPLRRTRTAETVRLYRVEPYVLAGDIAGVPPHRGRGGWTWYTGSAAWTYRLGLEAVLGVRLRGGKLHIDPCIPATWREYRVTILAGSARYEVSVRNPEGVCRGVSELRLDGAIRDDPLIPLADDGRFHLVEVRLGAAPEASLEDLGGRRHTCYQSGDE
jgi:cyclic beta-1,2-glucan synthetase